jgi:hypothetical protein
LAKAGKVNLAGAVQESVVGAGSSIGGAIHGSGGVACGVSGSIGRPCRVGGTIGRSGGVGSTVCGCVESVDSKVLLTALAFILRYEFLGLSDIVAVAADARNLS